MLQEGRSHPSLSHPTPFHSTQDLGAVSTLAQGAAGWGGIWGAPMLGAQSCPRLGAPAPLHSQWSHPELLLVTAAPGVTALCGTVCPSGTWTEGTVSSPRQDVDGDGEADAEWGQRGPGPAVDGSHADHQEQEGAHDNLTHEDTGDLLVSRDAAEGSSAGVPEALARCHSLRGEPSVPTTLQTVACASRWAHCQGSVGGGRVKEELNSALAGGKPAPSAWQTQTH